MFEQSIKNAVKVTKQRKKEALKTLNKIQKRLEYYKIDNSCTNWGDAGSMGYILDRLIELDDATKWADSKQ